MPEQKKERVDDVEEEKEPLPFDGEKKDDGILDDIDDLIGKRKEETKGRKDEPGE